MLHQESDLSEMHTLDEFDWEDLTEEWGTLDPTKKATWLHTLWLLFLKLSLALHIILCELQ